MIARQQSKPTTTTGNTRIHPTTAPPPTYLVEHVRVRRADALAELAVEHAPVERRGQRQEARAEHEGVGLAIPALFNIRVAAAPCQVVPHAHCGEAGGSRETQTSRPGTHRQPPTRTRAHARPQRRRPRRQRTTRAPAAHGDSPASTASSGSKGGLQPSSSCGPGPQYLP